MQYCNICRVATAAVKTIQANNNAIRFINISAAHSDRYRKMNRRNQQNSTGFNSVNPGVGRQLKILKEGSPDIDSKNVLTEEDFEELESDFLKAREMKQHYESTVQKLTKRDEFKMIERKHFKAPAEPNMLMWSDKEQIRLLHKEDPVKWDFNKLAASFPATVPIIKKILKSSWKPENSDRIKMHDEKVIKNWEEFSEGKLQVNCPILKKHLSKFSKRSILPHSSDSLKLLDSELPKPQGTEFVNIIGSYKMLNKSSVNEICDTGKESGIKDSPREISAPIVNRICSDESDLQITNKKPIFISNSHYTLDELRTTMRKKHLDSDPDYINESDRELLKGEIPNSGKSVKQIETWTSMTVTKPSPEHKEITKNDETMKNQLQNGYNDFYKKDLPARNVAKRIHIPKSKVKVGYLYKVDDCFYSHDGIFLYRVPGDMTVD